MKKMALLSLSILMTATAFVAFGCNKEETKTYTVTFKQAGYEDIVKTVDEGFSLTDIPTPSAKTGYTVEWEDVNLTNIKNNIVVNAVATANEYTITYDANGGTASVATQKVVYDSTVTLATATYAGYDFIGWNTQDDKAVLDGVWTIANNVTLVAKWQQKEDYTVTFRQAGQADIVKTVTAGTSLSATDVPTPAAKTGYKVSWNTEQLTAALQAKEGNLVVNAVETVKTYSVTLKNGNSEKTFTLKYGDAYDFGAVPEKTGYTFLGWKLDKDNVIDKQKGTWAYDVAETTTWTAVWEENDDEGNWTKNY